MVSNKLGIQRKIYISLTSPGFPSFPTFVTFPAFLGFPGFPFSIFFPIFALLLVCPVLSPFFLFQLLQVFPLFSHFFLVCLIKFCFTPHFLHLSDVPHLLYFLDVFDFFVVYWFSHFSCLKLWMRCTGTPGKSDLLIRDDAGMCLDICLGIPWRKSNHEY